jgi:YegS/Rv2252/BmrU family lipid kinase
MARVSVIWNPASRRDPRLAAATLAARGWHVDVVEARGRPEQRAAAAEAVAQSADLVVVVGGDGTVVEVVQVLAGMPIPLGIIPGGTGNLLATNLRIPSDPTVASRVLIDGRRRAIDLGHVENDLGGRHFAVACGVGFDAVVMQRTKDHRKRRFGQLAYIATAMAAAGQIRDAPLRLSVDGREWEMEADQVLIANVGGMTAWLRPRSPVAPDDGLLDVVVLRATGAWMGLAAVARGLLSTSGGHPTRGSLFRIRGRAIHVATDGPRPAELDGDMFGHAPLTASVLARAISIMVPR